MKQEAKVIPFGKKLNTNPDTIVGRLRAMRKALTVPQLAEMLSMGLNTAYVGVKAGRIPSYRIGQTVRLDPAQIADWLEAQQMAA